MIRIGRNGRSGWAGTTRHAGVVIPFRSGRPFVPRQAGVPVLYALGPVVIPFRSGRPFVRSRTGSRSATSPPSQVVIPFRSGRPFVRACRDHRRFHPECEHVVIPFRSGRPFVPRSICSGRRSGRNSCRNPLSVGASIRTPSLTPGPGGDDGHGRNPLSVGASIRTLARANQA